MHSPKLNLHPVHKFLVPLINAHLIGRLISHPPLALILGNVGAWFVFDKGVDGVAVAGSLWRRLSSWVDGAIFCSGTFERW